MTAQKILYRMIGNFIYEIEQIKEIQLIDLSITNQTSFLGFLLLKILHTHVHVQF